MRNKFSLTTDRRIRFGLVGCGRQVVLPQE